MNLTDLKAIKEENEAFLFAFNPDQPRDEDGKWTDGGGSSSKKEGGGHTRLDAGVATSGASNTPMTKQNGETVPHDASVDELRRWDYAGVADDIDEAQENLTLAEMLLEDIDSAGGMQNIHADKAKNLLLDMDASIDNLSDLDLLIANTTADAMRENAVALNKLLDENGHSMYDAENFKARNEAFLFAFDPNQPRDAEGQWTDTGAGEKRITKADVIKRNLSNKRGPNTRRTDETRSLDRKKPGLPKVLKQADDVKKQYARFVPAASNYLAGKNSGVNAADIRRGVSEGITAISAQIEQLSGFKHRHADFMIEDLKYILRDLNDIRSSGKF